MSYEVKKEEVLSLAKTISADTKIKGDEIFFKHCPYCKGGDNGDKDTFSINLNSGAYSCFRGSCGVKGSFVELARDFKYPLDNISPAKKKYKKLPQNHTPTPNELVYRYFEGRGISKAIVDKYHICQNKKEKNQICFPFYDENNILQFVKYRNTAYKKGEGAKEWCVADCKPILFGMAQCEDFDTVTITEGQCFPYNAEVLTENGWLKLGEYKGQKVLAVDEKFNGKFEKPYSYIKKMYSGDMVKVSVGGNYLSETTADHNLVFFNNKGKITKKQAKEKIPTSYFVKTAIELNNKNFEWSNDLIALFLAISADGTLDKRKTTNKYYARFGLTKQRKVDRLIEILEKLGIKYSNSKLKQEEKEYNSICFICPQEITTKELNWDFVTKTTIEQKKFIIEEMVHWDGCHINNRKQYEYYSINKTNIDVMQAVASTCGYMSTIMIKNNGGNGKIKKSKIFKLSVLLNKNKISTQQYEKNKQVYKAEMEVYCVGVSTGMLLIRQENKISVTGNCDSLALSECGIKNAVSVPTGCNGFTWLPHCYDWLLKFKKVIVFGDCENGKMTLIDKLRTSLPTKVYSVRIEDYLGEKDANDILMKYGKQAVIKAVENAKIEDVKFVKRLSEVKSVDIYSLPKIRTGIREIDKTIGGMYFGQVILLSGKRGEGKSTFLSQVVANTIEQGFPVFIYSGELPDYHFKCWLDLQIAGGDYLKSYIDEFGYETYYLQKETTEKINSWYEDKAYIFDNSAIDEDEYEGLLKIIVDSICRYEIKLVCIDNLMTALECDEKTDLFRQQSVFVKKLARIAKKYDVAILLIAHPKKTNTDFDNDAVSGSGDITNAVDVVLNYQRAKEDDDCDSLFTITKNRLTGKLITKEKAVKLLYSDKSKRIVSKVNPEIKKYSCFKEPDKWLEDVTSSLPF